MDGNERRKELINLSGQIINGMLSADSSIISKMGDRTFHNIIGTAAVNIATRILWQIDMNMSEITIADIKSTIADIKRKIEIRKKS